MKTAIIYPGQGSQFNQMGLDFYETNETYRKIWDEYFSRDKGLKDIWLNGENIHQTLNAQKVIFLNQYAIMEVLKENYDIKNVSYAGFSLGEYQAYLQTGVYDFKLGLDVVCMRGQIMDRVKSNYKIRVTMGITMEKLNDAIVYLKKTSNIEILVANYNLEKQILIAYLDEHLEIVERVLKENGMKKMIELNLSGPFHTSEYQDASLKFQKYINTLKLNEPKFDLYLNLTGDIYREECLDVVMRDHMTNGVLWYVQVQQMIRDGIKTFIEVGSKSVLGAMIKKIDRSVDVITIQSVEDISKVEDIWKRK